MKSIKPTMKPITNCHHFAAAAVTLWFATSATMPAAAGGETNAPVTPDGESTVAAPVGATADEVTVESLNAKLAASDQAWKKLREACQGNYEYDLHFQSFAGFSSTTTIVVKANKMVERKFTQRSNRPTAIAPPSEGKAPAAVAGGDNGWTEKSPGELGKHKDGAPAKTLDQLYQDVAGLVGKGIQEQQRWLTLFHKNGVIQYFGYTDKRIMDDAPFAGARIDALRLGPP